MIAEAVETLKTQDSRQHLDIDEYPMVTLANHHVPVLAKHGEKSDALGAAREYYERLKEIEEVSGDSRVKEAKEKMFKFVTTGRLETANKPRKPRGRKRIRR
jgi:hypothetical protein